MEGTSNLNNFEWLDVSKVPVSPDKALKFDHMDPLSFLPIKTEPIDEDENFCSQVMINKGVEVGEENIFLSNFTDILKKHIPTHKKDQSQVSALCTDIEVHKCRKCNSTLQSRVELLHHDKIKHSKKFTCSSCKKSWSSIFMLNDHLNRYHKNVKRVIINLIINSEIAPKNVIYNCKFCKKSFSKLSDLKYHVLHSHKKPKFVCIKCKKSWPRKHMFDSHVIKEHGVKVPVKVEYGDKNVINKLPKNSNVNSEDYYTRKFNLKYCHVKVERIKMI